MQQNQSEIGVILQQIEREYQAAQIALQSYAVTSPHAFITARLERMGQLHEQLREMIGEDAALLVVKCLEKIAE